MMTLTSSERRTALAAVIILASGVIAFRGVPSWFRWNQQLQDSASSVLAEARAAEELVLAIPALRQTLVERSEQVVALGPWTIGGDTPDAAAATLGQTLSSLCGAAGLQIESLQVSSDTLAWDDFAEITARLTLVGTYHSLLSGLTRLENGHPMLTVTALAIRRVGGTADDYEQNLRVDLTVAGLAFNVELQHEQ